MAHAHCTLIPKVTNTYLEYVILIVFQLKQLLREGASVLRYTYNVCVVVYHFQWNCNARARAHTHTHTHTHTLNK